jgi:hypothetical protein
MNCEKCGNPLEQGSIYCLNCGKVQGEAEAPPAPAQRTMYTAASALPPPPPPPPQATAPYPPVAPAPLPVTTAAAFEAPAQAGGFFSTSAGKVLAVVLALLVVGGLAVGIYFLVKGEEKVTVDESTVKVWEDYADLLEKDGKSLDPITYDAKALRQDQEAIRDSSEEVEDLEKDLKHAEVSQDGKAKADELADALASYGEYLAKLDKVYGDLAAALDAGTLKDPKVADALTAQLDEAQELATQTADLNDAFLKNNDAVSGKYDSDVLAVAEDMGPGLRQLIASALDSEKQRLEAEKAAAEQSAAEAAAAQAAAEAAAAQAQAEAEAARTASSNRSQVFYCDSTEGACMFCFYNGCYYDYNDGWFHCARCGGDWPVDSWNPSDDGWRP